jgi:transposase
MNVRLESLTYSNAMMITMSKEERTSLQSELATALAEGKSCAERASANGVSERTAQRWASESGVRAEVEAYRRGNLDPAVSRMSLRAVWATDQIAELAEKARSESVRLAALRSMLSDMMAVADFAGLEERIAKLEEQDRVRHEENAPAAN